MKNIKYFILFFSIVLFQVGCKNETSTANENNQEEAEVLPEDIVEMRDDQIKLANIETGKVEYRSVNGTLKANGVVITSPQNYATVCMPMGGFVKKTTLVTGSLVKQGQTLAIVENQDFIDLQQSYLEARNKFEFAEAEFNRHTELYQEAVYSQENMQQVSADFKSLKAQVKSLEQKLSMIGIDAKSLDADRIRPEVVVTAPISGYIKAVHVNIGKYMGPSDVLFEIVNRDQLLLELTVFEKDAGQVSANQQVAFYVNNETEKHNALIYQAAQSVEVDKTLKAYARITGNCKSVLPGMFVNAIIETSQNRVSALPSEAVVSFDEKDYIFVYEKEKEEDGKPFTEYRMIQVKKGISENGYTEIELPEGFDVEQRKVVVKGAYNLLSAKKNAGEMAC